MNLTIRITFTAAIALLGATLTLAADLAGKWTSDFDSPIGPQKYVYHFKSDGGKTTGTASYDHSMGKGDSVLSDITVDKDDISFLEAVHLNDTDLKISYKGKISGDEMKLHRIVGDYGSEDIVVKRAKSEGKTEMKN